MSTHRVAFRLDDQGNWLVRATDIRGCHSYGRSLSEARNNIREAITLFVEPGNIELIERLRLPRSARSAVTACLHARATAEAAEHNAVQATAAAARALSEVTGLGVRDIGELLGLSHQRISQLLSRERRTIE